MPGSFLIHVIISGLDEIHVKGKRFIRNSARAEPAGKVNIEKKETFE